MKWAAAFLVGSLAIAACDGDRLPLGERVRPLLGGDARLVGYGSNACSRGEPASGDGHRWCAFYRQAGEQTELWVLDVTRALGGEVIPCDGSSRGCRRLTDQLFTGVKLETPSHPEGHRFEGDTLLFLADPHLPAAALDRYEGRVFAWRPGWEQPRALTSERGVLCNASDVAAVAFCVDGVAEQPRVELDLRAGRLVDRDEPLPVVERIVATHGREISWSVQLSQAGDELAFSSVRDGDLSETLRVSSLADPTAPRAVMADGSRWQLSADGRTVYFLRAVVAMSDGPAGTLWGADFPSGANASPIAEGVHTFEAAGGRNTPDRGVVFLTDLKNLEGTLHVVRDRRRPAQRLTLSQDVHFWRLSPDGRVTYILRSTRSEEKGHLADNETGAICTLGTRPDVTVFGVSFLPRLGLTAWTQPASPDSDAEETFLSGPGCAPTALLGAGVEYLLELGETTLLVGRRTSDADNRLVLTHERPVAAAAVAATVLLSSVAANSIAPVGARPEALVVGTHDDRGNPTGLHLVGPLPRD